MVATTGNETTRQAARTVTLLVIGAVLLGIVFSVIGDAVRHVSSGVELRFLQRIDEGPSAAVTVTSKVLSTFGSQTVLVPIVVAACIVLLVRHAMPTASFLAASAAGSIVLSSVVKAIVNRPRPALPHLVHVASASFPSGHATQTAAILPALAIAAAARSGAGRSAAVAIAAVGSVAVGISRLMLGVHYPTDVVAGWLLGGIWVVFVYFVLFADKRAPR